MEQEIPDDGIIRIQYQPRPQFIPFHNRQQRFACIVAHRRAGKTVACIHDLQRAAIRCELERPRFAYMAPTYSQAKAVAFDYLRDAASPIFPYGASVNTSELRVDYPNGSQVRLFGADNYDALRGLRLDGVVLDEFADFDPRAWPEVIRPALSDRRGTAVFIGTPKGHNAFYDLWEKAKAAPEWFTLDIKASQTVPLNDLVPEAEAIRQGLLTSSELESARRTMSEEEYAQEYETSFEAAIKGAFYGKQMAEAERTGRIRSLPFDPALQVYTAWDIGGDHDATAIWFCQQSHKEIYLIDYYEAVGADSAPHAKAVLEKPYSYALHFLPHDAGPRRIGSDKSYQDFLEGHGLRNTKLLPQPRDVQVGINAARLALPRCYFDKDKCALGIEVLKMFRSGYDEKNRILKSGYIHDWASHGARAFDYLITGLESHVTKTNFSRKILYPRLGVA